MPPSRVMHRSYIFIQEPLQHQPLSTGLPHRYGGGALWQACWVTTKAKHKRRGRVDVEPRSPYAAEPASLSYTEDFSLPTLTTDSAILVGSGKDGSLDFAVYSDSETHLELSWPCACSHQDFGSHIYGDASSQLEIGNYQILHLTRGQIGNPSEKSPTEVDTLILAAHGLHQYS